MAIPDDRQEPRFRIGASKTVKASIGAQDGILHEIIGITRRGSEPAGKSIGGIQMRQDLPLEATAPVTHRLAGRCMYATKVAFIQATRPPARPIYSQTLQH